MTGDAFILSLDSFFEINGPTIDSKKIFVVVALVVCIKAFINSLSGDNTASSRRSASKTKCKVS